MLREAVVLAGGRSSRMGQDKAALEVDGAPLLDRIVATLVNEAWKVTILGGHKVLNAAFLPDRLPFQGPLASLREFHPKSECVFVLSCDLPLFDPRIPDVLERKIGESDAAIPEANGSLQPLCGLYRNRCWRELTDHPEWTRMFRWLHSLDVAPVCEADFAAAGIDPLALCSFNTPEELEQLLMKSRR